MKDFFRSWMLSMGMLSVIAFPARFMDAPWGMLIAGLMCGVIGSACYYGYAPTASGEQK